MRNTNIMLFFIYLALVVGAAGIIYELAIIERDIHNLATCIYN